LVVASPLHQPSYLVQFPCGDPFSFNCDITYAIQKAANVDLFSIACHYQVSHFLYLYKIQHQSPTPLVEFLNQYWAARWRLIRLDFVVNSTGSVAAISTYLDFKSGSESELQDCETC
jgi:hypothetical protein